MQAGSMLAVLLSTVALALHAAAAPAATVADCEPFDGTWRLERITDGERSRADLDERLTLRCRGDSIGLEYRITDRFGTRTLEFSASLDGVPREQRVQSRPARVSARIDGGQLELRIEREAPFGHVHNSRLLRLGIDRRILESRRVNFRRDGREHSAWLETWIRVE